MIRCTRCNEQTPRTHLHQRYCPRCEREVAVVISIDERRRKARFGSAKDLTGTVA